MTNREFYQRVRQVAEGVQGISPEGTAAHAANESAWGTSRLTQDGNNLFGLKAGSSWKGRVLELPTWEIVGGARVDVMAAFRAYGSWEESVRDYAEVIGRLYPFAAAHPDDAVAFLAGVFLMGPYKWATDPDAFVKVLRILEQMGGLGGEREPVGVPVSLGRFDEVVDNSPGVGAATKVLLGALSGAPVPLGPHVASVTVRPDGSRKLDLRTA